MILLPRGNPIKENVDPGKVNLPDALQKLQAGSFTGYLRFDGRTGTGILIFEQGKLISALFEEAGERIIAFDALARIFERSLQGGLKLNIYRLSADLAMSIHALLHGDVLYRGQELKLMNIKGLLAKLKEDQLNGCLRIYTDERIALIFYREGNPLGFFHDGSKDLETDADSSMSVARLPGAKVDVLSTKNPDAVSLTDLLATGDIPSLWQRAKDVLAKQRQSQQAEASRSAAQRDKLLADKALAFLKATAEKNIGKIGVSLVEKEFDKALAGKGSIGAADLAPFYAQLSKAAKLVAGPTKVQAMVEEMQRGVQALMRQA